MSKKVFKYQLDENDDLHVPENAVFLHLAEQDSRFGKGTMAWYLVEDEEEALRKDHIELVPTGATVPDLKAKKREYIGRLEMEEFIFHVFKYEDMKE